MTAVVKWVFEDYWQGQTQTVTFYPSGAPVDFVVPASTTIITASLLGGAGGGALADNVPGGGSLVVAFPVTPGETIHIRVGGDGSRDTPDATGATGGYNGGGDGGNFTGTGSHSGGFGGGGATDIRQGGDDLSDRIVVAAGAGGNSGTGSTYGGGVGGPQGGSGASTREVGLIEDGLRDVIYTTYGGQGAQGMTAPGDAGQNGAAHGATAGDLGVGGDGANSAGNGGGGGGAGWEGGGGGGLDTDLTPYNAGGGGGGSNGTADGVIVLQNGAGIAALAHDTPYVSLEFIEQADRYVFEINPNDNGALTIIKSILMTQTTGPNRVNILQEGTNQAPLLDFSGIILTQQQLEAMELWFDRRVFLKVTDDLGREYYGVFSTFTPKRVRHASNFWYHTYDAEFTIAGYRNASGQWVYGRVG